MSIQSEITRISGNVQDSLAAVEEKGVTVPEGSGSDELAGLIAQISAGTSTLPEQVTLTALTLTAMTVELSWENPTEYFAGLLIVRKAGSLPTSPTDGDAVYNGSGTTYTDTDVESDVTYFYRPYPYNSDGSYQTVLTGYAQATPTNGIPLTSIPAGIKNILTPEGQWFDKLSVEKNGCPTLLSQYTTTTRTAVTSNPTATSEINAINSQILAKYSDAVRALMVDGGVASQCAITEGTTPMIRSPFNTNANAVDSNRLRESRVRFWCSGKTLHAEEVDDEVNNYYWRYYVDTDGRVKYLSYNGGGGQTLYIAAYIPFSTDVRVSAEPNASGQYTLMV